MTSRIAFPFGSPLVPSHVKKALHGGAHAYTSAVASTSVAGGLWDLSKLAHDVPQCP